MESVGIGGQREAGGLTGVSSHTPTALRARVMFIVLSAMVSQIGIHR